MRKTLTALAASCLLAVAGCTGGGAGGGTEQNPVATDGKITGEITFQTWSLKNDKFTPYFEKVIADFEKQHEGVKINWIDQPGDGYEAKILQQADSGELPDVVNLPDDFAYQLAKLDKLVDLKASAPDTLGAYVDGGLGSYTFDKEGAPGTYAYPWYLGTDLNWWNMQVMEKAGYTKETLPKSEDEWFEAAKKVKEVNGTAAPLISSMPDVTTLAKNGVEIYQDGKFVFNTDKAAEVVNRYAKAYADGLVPPESLNDDYQSNSLMFPSGKTAHTTATTSFVTQIENDAPTLLPLLAATPKWDTPPLFVQGVSVAKQSKNMATALAFAEFVTNNANQVEFVKLAQGFMPGTKEANENPESFTADIKNPALVESVKMAADQMDRAEDLIAVQYTNDMKQYVGQQIALAMKGEISAKDALDKAVEYCNKAL
ncbi:hypothetical protein BSZ39_08545 [Bowdeniella nasicola]|uniref:ABC transporter substrate-binding protein n=1 Tax=Bowdeniella nasicola TaxID=208480 RepID=A0A1Q5Q1J0_9ACTO|nr:extracellular solute-binding protein [Bowdeniella nasicola]OKL53626.1 hypothetical protein BSZ39_08545 [Bowdeniella nasicola]